ncbi:putative beta-1,3-galactosyltransferase 8 [Acorus calamus]|uniref:Hexosyltransferase n=1 Tax=Acorus calamus TaxID=4465 RepID=A0AAV9FD12_ACOCL|nr:putative beta-1,3-galactosyltransferase 8 [Acorus calamus]
MLRVAARPLSGKAIFSLCVMSFFVGLLFSGRMWTTGGGGGRRLVEVMRGSDHETKHISFFLLLLLHEIQLGLHLTRFGSKLRRLEKEKGMVIRFVIGHSATPGGILDCAIDAEEAKTKDFLRLDHIEGYHELSAKTRLYFFTVVSIWDANFYVKVNDDVHVNLGMLETTLA